MPRTCSSPETLCEKCRPIYKKLQKHKLPKQLTPDVIFPLSEVYPFVLKQEFPANCSVEISEEFVNQISDAIKAWCKERYDIYDVDKLRISFNATDTTDKRDKPITHFALMVDAPESMILTAQDIGKIFSFMPRKYRERWSYVSFEEFDDCMTYHRLKFFYYMVR
ncbi:uncharacterized protein DSM5745_02708 [Aspergillus mulundensis]|uniref:Uncharacterized protein n=1 Tax=Aspergillus mulundensis TaxID=1810919 RepID=A0A3D8SIF1_9EURO|nr:hypothetical protein DSM5745_02708 [Aspergillus mulundensis]RDW86066.1 hypothetical protein DSM5745_02708 [Aspergillus mulundensis]